MRPTWRGLLLGALVAAACAGCGKDESRVRIGQHEWRVEIAADPQTRQRGLGFRDEVPEGTGMLFVFPHEVQHPFHMLHCRVPIDIAFISATGTIVEIRTMAVEPDPANPASLYPSGEEYLYALEVAGGTFRRLGVAEGDTVELLGRARDAVKGAR